MDTSTSINTLQTALATNKANGDALQLAMDLLNGIANPQLAQLQTLSDQNTQLSSELSSEQAKTADLTAQVANLQAQIAALTPVAPSTDPNSSEISDSSTTSDNQPAS